MPSFSIHAATAFEEELFKGALAVDVLRRTAGFLGRQAGAAGAGLGAGGLVGAASGGGLGALRSYRDAREQGATGGQAVGEALVGAGRGALRGGLAGAATGGALGLAGGQQATNIAKRLAAGSNPLASAARFGQRQVHSVTGAVPQGFGSRTEAIRAMRAGAAPAVERAAAAEKALGSAWSGGDSGALRKAVGEKLQAGKGLRAAEEAERLGMTSVPGFLKAVSGAGETTLKGRAQASGRALKAGFGQQWHQSGTAGKALTVGLPAAAVVGEAAKPSEDRGARIGQVLGGQLAYMAAPIPLVGAGLLAAGAGKAGKLLGSVAKRRPVIEQSPAGPAESDEAGPVVQRFQSNAAMGRPPEGLMG